MHQRERSAKHTRLCRITFRSSPQTRASSLRHSLAGIGPPPQPIDATSVKPPRVFGAVPSGGSGTSVEIWALRDRLLGRAVSDHPYNRTTCGIEHMKGQEGTGWLTCHSHNQNHITHIPTQKCLNRQAYCMPFGDDHCDSSGRNSTWRMEGRSAEPSSFSVYKLFRLCTRCVSLIQKSCKKPCRWSLPITQNVPRLREASLRQSLQLTNGQISALP